MYYIFLYLFLCIAHPVFAGQPTTGLDQEPSVDAAAVANISDHPVVKDTAERDVESDETTSSDPASSYVYDLKKLIIKSRENIKRVNEKIKEQSVVKRNQKREERAREYYEKGLELQDEGKFDEAREYFEKAINITEHPEMVKYIGVSAQKLKSQEAALKRQEKQQLRSAAQDKQAKLMDAATAYTQAVAYYKEKKYKEAKDMFIHVQELSDNYKGTQSYLRIIDQNILQSETASAKVETQEMRRQEEEAERARQREKENWRKEVEQKEKDRKNQINTQADNVYAEAVTLYKSKKFMEAKKKFQEVEWVVPDYKAARDYIARADKDMAVEQARVEAIKAKELSLQQWEEEVARRKKEALDQKEAQEKEKQRIKQLEEQVAFIYQSAVNLFDKKSYDEALEKFNDVEKTLSGYKSTKAFIAKIAYIKEKEKQKQDQIIAAEVKRKAQEAARKQKEDDQAKEAEAKRKAIQEQRMKTEAQKVKESHNKPIKSQEQQPLDLVTPVVEPKPAMTKEEEIDEAKTIEALSRRSAQVLQKISALADDKRIAPVKRKMAKVDEMLKSIKQQKENILQQLRAEEEREQQRQLKIAQEQKMAKIKDSYDEAIMNLRNQNYEQAQILFVSIENEMPNYKMTRWYLSHIKEDEQKAERQAVLERTHNEEVRLKALEEKREQEALAQQRADEERRKAEEARKRQLRAAQESEVQVLADKAVNLNDEILLASKNKDFTTAKAKFTELEKVLETLEALKRTMQAFDLADEEKNTPKPLAVKRAVAAPVPVVTVKKIKAMPPMKVVEQQQRDEHLAIKKARQKESQDHAKRILSQRMAQEKAKRQQQDYAQDELRRQKEEVFDHAVSLYKQKKFTAAKVIFDDLSIQDYPGAKAYLKKIDRYYEKAAAKSDAGNERERSDFIAEQIRKQRLSNLLAEKERAHQRELTAQLERQRKLASEEDQRQKIKIEAMKLKEKDRLRQEQERAREQSKRKKEDEELQFRKIPPVTHKQESKKEEPVTVLQPVKLDDLPEQEQEVIKDKPVINDKQEKETKAAAEKAKQDQIDFSNKRKKFFEEQQLKEDKIRAEEARKEEAEKKKKEAEDRKKEMEARKQEIQAQQKKDAEDRIKDLEKKQQELIERKKKEAQARQKEIERKQQEAIERKKQLSEERQRAIERRQIEIERKQKELEDRKKKLEQERQEALERKRKEVLESQQKEEQRRLKLQEEQQRLEQVKLEEQQRREALKRQQEQQLAEIKRRETLAAQARERQKQLDLERKAIEARLTESAATIYDEAMRLYERGNYQVAYNKFKDLEDVLPDFRQTRKLMEQCKLYLSKPVLLNIPPLVTQKDSVTKQAPQEKEKKLTKEEMMPPVDRDQAIKKTLEVFDSPTDAK